MQSVYDKIKLHAVKIGDPGSGPDSKDPGHFRGSNLENWQDSGGSQNYPGSLESSTLPGSTLVIITPHYFYSMYVRIRIPSVSSVFRIDRMCFVATGSSCTGFRAPATSCPRQLCLTPRYSVVTGRGHIVLWTTRFSCQVLS